MFFCCEEKYQKGDHALQIFQTPKEMSTISQDKEVVFRGFVPGPKSKLINNISSTNKPGSLNNILNFIKTHHDDFEEFVLKKVMKSNYEKLVEEYAKSNRGWTDPDFPPEQKSFGLGRTSEKVIWKRLGDIIKKPVFIGEEIHPSDILQGRIGDCYFLSAIAGLAQKDYRITMIFPNTQLNKNGIYMARVLHKGVYKQVVVDDYFPCNRKDGRLMGAAPSGGNEIWVMILQKCWAKLYGSFEAIDGGLPNEVLHAFSAAPTYQYLTDVTPEQLDEIFFKMLQADQNEWVICCGTNSNSNVEQMGLVEGHAYTILSVYEQPRRLLKIRNPWGQKEWAGRGSDKDYQFWNRVSKSDKLRMGMQNKNDGVFFMFWQDFLNFFQIVNICKVDDRANYYYEQLTYPKNMGVFTALSTKGGHATLSITQQNTRGIDVESPRYANSTIIIAKKIPNKGYDDYMFVASLTDRNNCDTNLQIAALNQGDFVVYTSLSGRNPKEEATISCYCESAVQLNPVSTIKSEQFLHRVFLDHARKNKENHQKIFGAVDVWVCMDIVYDSGFAYTVVHIGPGIKTKLGLTFNEQQYEQNNFQLLPPFKGSGTFKIVCENGQDSIVLCRIIPRNYAIQASLPIPNIKRLC